MAQLASLAVQEEKIMFDWFSWIELNFEFDGFDGLQDIDLVKTILKWASNISEVFGTSVAKIYELKRQLV